MHSNARQTMLRPLYPWVRILVAAIALACCGGAVLEESAPPGLVREVVRVPVDGYALAITILRPDGNGPYGALVLNHGTPASARARAHESSTLFMHTAAVFAQRNYAVFMPLRRGFGATGGAFAEDTGPCSEPDFHSGERAAASDVLAAYEFARKMPYVDRARIILAGQSAGGVASLYAAAQRPEGLVAVLAFAAGRGADPEHPGIPCAIEPLAAVFADLGNAVEAPVLLHYAENDRSFGPAATQLWFKRFKAGGAQAEYVLQPPFGDDGHYVFSDPSGVERWLPQVEGFLLRHGIPFDASQQRA